MNLVYTGNRASVEAALGHGLEGDAPIRLRPVGDGFAWLEAEAALILEAPDEAVARFRESSSNGKGESFAVPAAELEGWRIVAHHGLADQPTRPFGRRRWPIFAATAGLFTAVVVATTFAVGNEDDPPARPASPPRAVTAAPAGPAPAPPTRADGPPSRALGTPTDGRLANGVSLPGVGEHFFTWDSTRQRSPNPRWRRFGTEPTVQSVLDVVAAFGRAHPAAARVGIADLSLPRGGTFGLEYGGRGHLSHQNGLDVDVLYPLRSRREAEGQSAAEIDRSLSQDLLDRFVAAGAVEVFVGSDTGLSGPDGIVTTRARHDTHMHIRLGPPEGGGP